MTQKQIESHIDKLWEARSMLWLSGIITHREHDRIISRTRKLREKLLSNVGPGGSDAKSE